MVINTLNCTMSFKYIIKPERREKKRKYNSGTMESNVEKKVKYIRPGLVFLISNSTKEITHINIMMYQLRRKIIKKKQHTNNQKINLK